MKSAGLEVRVDAVGNVQAASDLNLVATSRVLILITETDIEGDLP